MIIIAWILLGICLGAAVVWLSRAVKSERAVFGTGLIIGSVGYLAYGALAGRELSSLTE